MSHGWDVVRARNSDNGSSYTTTRIRAEWRGDKILDGVPALDKHGRWRPPTPKTNLEPVRDDHGRFTTNEPDTGEEES